MPTLRHHHPNPPTLRLGKAEQKLLETARSRCIDIRNLTAGVHPELSTLADETAERLGRLSAIEDFDLTKPF